VWVGAVKGQDRVRQVLFNLKSSSEQAFFTLRSKASSFTVFELRVHANDLGKVIGRQGRTAQAIRMILTGVGMKLRKCFTLEILE